DVSVSEGSDVAGVKAAARLAERGSLAQDRQPAQTGLERLEGDPLEQGGLSAYGQAPLGVVIFAVDRMRRGPRAACDAVVADDRCAVDGLLSSHARIVSDTSDIATARALSVPLVTPFARSRLLSRSPRSARSVSPRTWSWQ